MKRNKICIITPMIYPVPAVKGGAVETLVELLVKMNERFNQAEFTVISVFDAEAEKKSREFINTKFVFIKRGDKWDQFFSKKAFVYINKVSLKLWNKTLISLPYTKRALHAIEKNHYDMYVLEGGGDYYNFGYLNKKIDFKKLSIHFHGEVEGSIPLKKWFNNYFVVSNYIGRKLICNGIIDPKFVHVLPNCYDNLDAANDSTLVNYREQFGISKDEIVFVFWGRLIPQKGVYELLKAFSIAHQSMPKSKLLIIGNATFGKQTYSEYDRKLSDICDTFDLNNSVIFTGFLQHEKVKQLLQKCDVGVIPSLWDDPAPLTVFEGLASGLAIIASNVGGIPEIIEDGNNGLLLSWSENYINDLARMMTELYKNTFLRQELSRRAKASVSKYDAESYYFRFIKALGDACDD